MKNEIIVNMNGELPKYFELKSLGYKVLWVGNNLACLVKGV